MMLKLIYVFEDFDIAFMLPYNKLLPIDHRPYDLFILNIYLLILELCLLNIFD